MSSFFYNKRDKLFILDEINEPQVQILQLLIYICKYY